MLVRRRHRRRLLRQADGAGRGREAHRRRALRSGRAGLDGVGSRHPRRHRDLVRAGGRPRDPDHRLLRGHRRRSRPLRARDRCARPTSMPATSCRTTPRPRSSAPARAGSRCWKASGLRHITLAPLHRVEDGINAVRVFLPRCWFDAEKCARGIDALKLYRAEYDDKLQALRPQPGARLDLARGRCVPLSRA